jgi:hypothetical protein
MKDFKTESVGGKALLEILRADNGPQPLVDRKRLLEILFDESSRPSPRWLASMLSRRLIPYKKIGRLVRFDVAQVRAALEKRCTVQVRE